MPIARCATLESLKQAVIVAVRALHSAKPEQKIEARKAEHAAVKALEAHIKEHNCKLNPMEE